MDNFIDILKVLNNNSNAKDNHRNSSETPIPKEIIDQYPYGQFPSRYTKSGQEDIRKNSENRFLYTENQPQEPPTQNQNFDINSLIPLIQILSSKKNSTNDIMQTLSKLLFKDNKEMENLFNLFANKNKSQEIKSFDNFPNTNKVNISSLRKINE